MPRLLLILLIACADPEPSAPPKGDDDTDNGSTDTPDPIVDTEDPPGGGETDGPGGPAPGDDTDSLPVVDSDLPPIVRNLGPGFVDLDTALFAAFPRHVALRVGGVGGDSDQAHGFFADLDFDGHNEIVLVGTAPDDASDRAPWVLRFDAASQQLTPDTTLSARVAVLDPLVMGLVDLDGDGDLDGIPGRYEDTINAGRANGTFDPPRQRLPYDPGMMGGALVDLDQDGWTDVLRVAGGCRGAPWSLFGRTNGAWRDRVGIVGPENPSSPYTAGVMRLNGLPYVLGLGLGCDRALPAPAFFMPGVDSIDGYPVFVGTDITPPDSAYKLVPFVAGGPMTRRNPMGGTLADFDGDGDLDLAVSSVDDRILMFADEGSVPLTDRTLDWDALLPPRADDGSGLASYETIKPWGIAALDLDRDNAVDLVVQTGNDFSDAVNFTPGLNLLVALFQERGRFVEDSAAAGLGFPAGGRSLTVGDLDDDGRPDLIVGSLGHTPRILLNRIEGGRPPIGLRLIGTTSGRWPEGAVVQVIDDGVVGPALAPGGVVSPGPFSDPVAFASTGADGVADLVRIRWPSGYIQEIPGLTAWTTHDIVEPETLRVEPAGRTVSYDGSTARLVLTPRGPDGAPAPATIRVEVRGEGSAGAPVDIGNGQWEVQISSELTPGYALVDVWFDQTPVGVHPRITWANP